MKTILAALLALSSPPAFASDHIDGPVTTTHRVADLSDLYAFPTPGKSGSLTVVLNTYPLVPASGHFTDKVTYSIYFRRASVKGTGDRAYFETSDEVAVHCNFQTPDDVANHVLGCKSSNGLEAEVKYEEVREKAEGDDFRLYSGMRSDTFFFNAGFATDAAKGKLNKPKDSDVMSGTNILTIVLEVEPAKLFKGAAPALIAVATEATTKDSPSAPVRRLDRLGRPEITNVSMAPRDEADLRDQFNLDRPFQVATANQQQYKEKIARNIAFYDQLDKKKDWKDNERDSLATLLADDFLVVDISKPCGNDSFLEIEKAVLAHKAHETCGGRKLTDDIMDTLFTAYIAGLGGERVRDGVDKPTAPTSSTFPYLSEPDLSLSSRVKSYLAKKLLGIPNMK